jgi:hypothetical protein
MKILFQFLTYIILILGIGWAISRVFESQSKSKKQLLKDEADEAIQTLKDIKDVYASVSEKVDLKETNK